MTTSRKIFLESLGLAIVLTLGTFLVGVTVGWIEKINPLEAFAVFTSYSCTYMCVRQSRWNYPMGILTTFIYSWFYWTAEPTPAVALAVFNLYLVGSLAFGYFRWGPDGNPKPVTRVEPAWWSAYLGATAAVAAGLAIAIYFGAVISGLEIGIVVLSAFAQFLLDNKKLETWVVWIGVNVLSIYFYWKVGWYLVMFQYVFFLGNAFWGMYEWRKSYRTNVVPTAVGATA